jgi:hypothetical protein
MQGADQVVQPVLTHAVPEVEPLAAVVVVIAGVVVVAVELHEISINKDGDVRRGPVRGVVGHAAQQHVHGKDGAQEVHRVQDIASRNATIRGSFKFMALSVRDDLGIGCIKKGISENVNSRPECARNAASAHPSAVSP